MKRSFLGFSLVVGLVAACRPSSDLVVAPPVVVERVAPALSIPPPRADGRLPDDVRPTGYRWTLEVDPSGKRFRGEVRIALEIVRETRAVILHGAGLTIDSAEVGTGERLLSGKASFRRAAGAEHGGGSAEELVVEVAEALPPGTAELRIAYQAPLDDKLRGLYRTERDGKSYLVTQLEPADARRVLPCFDDPSYKVPVDLSVIAPRGQRVFANSALLRERDAGEDTETGVARVRHDFETTRPLPTYLLALAVGPFDVYEGPRDPVPVRVIAPSGMADRGGVAAAMASDLLAIFARRFGTPYPYSKLDLVAVPAFAAGAMENAGLVTFREELLLVDAKSSARARRNALQLMAHELAHQWFGDLVTLRWWDDLWLNEGSASYFEGLAADEWRPETRAELEDLVHLGSVMRLDGLDSARRVREPVRTVYEAEEAFDAITYSKGSAILGMLHSYLGDEPFRRGVGLYLTRHAHANATARDLFDALGEARRIDVAGIASSFVDQPGVPVVRVTRSCEGGRGRLALEQRRHRPTARASDEGRWRIPMCLRYELEGSSPSASSAARRVCTLLAEPRQELALDGCPSWIAPNEDHRGYYRYAMTADELRRLWRSTPATDVRARVGFLGNAWGLVESGELELVELLGFLEEAAASRDLETMTVVVELVDRLALTVVDEPSRASFGRWVSGLFSAAAKDLGWQPRRGERDDVPLVRELVFEVLGVHASTRALEEEAARRASAYLRSPESVSPDVAGVALRIAARRRAVDREALLRALAADSAPEHRIRLLRALGSLGEPAELQRALDLILSGGVRPSDARYLARAAAATETGRAVLAAWLEANFNALVSRTDPMSASSYLTSYARACSEEERARVAGVFGPLVTQLGGSSRRLSEALESIGVCVDLRARQASAARAWFAAWTPGRKSR